MSENLPVLLFAIIVAIGSIGSFISINAKTALPAYVFASLICTLLVAYCGFRTVVTETHEGRLTDTAMYVDYFNELRDAESLANGTLAWKGDFLFFLLPMTIKMLGGNSAVFLFANSLFSIAVLVVGFVRILKLFDIRYMPMALVCFVTSGTFVACYCNLLRQAMALSVLVIAVSLLLSDMKVYAVGLCLLSCLIHKSSIVFLPVFVLPLHFQHLKSFLFAASVAMILNVTGVFRVVGTFGIPFVSEKIVLYELHSETNKTLLLFSLVALVLLISVMLTFGHRSLGLSRLLGISGYFLIFAILLSGFPTIGKRTLYFAIPFIAISISVWLSENGKKRYIVWPVLATLVWPALYFPVLGYFSRTFSIVDFTL